MTTIAENIFQELNKLQANLPRVGMYAGQSIATIYQKLIQHPVTGVVNDIDHFIWLSEDSDIYNGYKKGKPAFKHFSKKLNKNNLNSKPIGAKIIKDADEYEHISFFAKDKGTYSVFASVRDDLLNQVFCVVSNRDLLYNFNPKVNLDLLLNSFDLNCVQIGITFDKKGNAILSMTKEYEDFLKSHQLLLVNFPEYICSIYRANKKLKEMTNVYFDINPYINAIKDIQSFSDSKYVLSEYWSHQLHDFLVEFNIDTKVSSSYNLSSMDYYKNQTLIKVHLQEKYQVPYGFTKNDIMLIQDLKKHELFSEAWEPIKQGVISIKRLFKAMSNAQRLNIEKAGLTYSINHLLFVEFALKHYGDHIIGQMETMNPTEKRGYDLKEAFVYRKLISLIDKNNFDEAINCLNNFDEQMIQKNIINIKFLETVRETFQPLSWPYKVDIINKKTDLIKLGQKEHHCVGGYWNNILSGESIIVKITDHKGQVSTAELGKVRNPFYSKNVKDLAIRFNAECDFMFKVEQHYFAFNKPIDDIYREFFVLELTKALNCKLNQFSFNFHKNFYLGCYSETFPSANSYLKFFGLFNDYYFKKRLDEQRYIGL